MSVPLLFMAVPVAAAALCALLWRWSWLQSVLACVTVLLLALLAGLTSGAVSVARSHDPVSWERATEKNKNIGTVSCDPPRSPPRL